MCHCIGRYFAEMLVAQLIQNFYYYIDVDVGRSSDPIRPNDCDAKVFCLFGEKFTFLVKD